MGPRLPRLCLVGHPASPAVSWRPVATCAIPVSPGLASRTGAVSVWLCQWLRVGVSVPDPACPYLFWQLPWRLVSLLVSGPVPGQPHEVGEAPPLTPQCLHHPGSLQSPPYCSLRRTAHRLIFLLLFFNFWSTTTTLVGSPPLPRNEIPGHEHQIVAVRADKQHNCTFIIVYYHNNLPADWSSNYNQLGVYSLLLHTISEI